MVCIICYPCWLARSSNTGIMEMVVKSKAVSAVLAENSNVIMNFFRAEHPDPTAPYGIDPKVAPTPQAHTPCARLCLSACSWQFAHTLQ